jgi:glycogen debranching enzyme
LESGTLEVRVGPPRLTIHADEEFLVCAPDGTISSDDQHGYFSEDTRIASCYRVTLARQSPVLLNSAVVAAFSARYEFANAETSTSSGRISSGDLHLRLDRTLHHGLHEDYDVTNYSPRRIELELELTIEGDYADLFDVKERRLVRRGVLDSRWDPDARALTTMYRNDDFERGLTIEVRRQGSEPEYANGRLGFRIAVEPKESWHCCLLWKPIGADGNGSGPIEECHALLAGDSDLSARRREWRRRATTIRTGDREVDAVLEQAVDDLGSLRMHRHDEAATVHHGDGIEEMVLAGGIPWFVSLFGRDSLVVSLQTPLLTPGFATGTLQALATLQGDSYDDRRDLQPGKIEHELRQGELAHFGLVPQTPYYGSHDVTALYVWAAAEAWRWTANHGLLEQLRPNVERALAWIDRDGDHDGDGLQEYRTRAGDWGYYNQGWKDAGDAIVGADGKNAELPIATCELQGYVVAAKRAWADTLEEAFGESADARRLRDEAERLAELIERRFWWEAEGTYYLALDGRKQPVESVASNAGHLLWARAVADERASSVVRRLLEQDMWSGWGVRTLSSQHPSYNPLSYQRGSVWPHDNAILANGCALYGHGEAAGRIARALLDAASRFRYGRLPEVFGGLERDDGSFPVQYLGANVPQAWASGAVIHLVHGLLGLEPDAAGKTLRLQPQLPAWLEEVELGNLRVGEGWVDLRVGSAGVAVEGRRGDEVRVCVDPGAGPSDRGGRRGPSQRPGTRTIGAEVTP